MRWPALRANNVPHFSVGMNPDISTACHLLEQEPLRNLSTLKMLNYYPKSVSFELHQGPDGWALLSLLDVRGSEWDRNAYPACKYVAFINGNSPSRKLQLLASLPHENLVLKTGAEIIRKWVIQTGRGTSKVEHPCFYLSGQGLRLARVPSNGPLPLDSPH